MLRYLYSKYVDKNSSDSSGKCNVDFKDDKSN